MDDLSDGIAFAEEPTGQRLGQHHGVRARQGRLGVAAQERQAKHVENAGFRSTNLFISSVLVPDPK